MATHSSIHAWRIPWTEGLQGYNPWGHEESDKIERLTLSLSPWKKNNILFWLEWELFSPSDILPYADLWALEHIVRACLSSVSLDLLGRFSLGLSSTCVWGALEAKLNQAQVLWSETLATPELGCILPVGGEGVTCLQAQKDCDVSSLDDLWLSMCLLHGPPQQVGGMLDCGLLSSRARLARISWLPLGLRQVCGTNSSRGLWEWKPSSNMCRSFRNSDFSFILYKLNVKLSLPHLFSNSWFYYTAFSL